MRIDAPRKAPPKSTLRAPVILGSRPGLKDEILIYYFSNTIQRPLFLIAKEKIRTECVSDRLIVGPNFYRGMAKIV